MKESPKKTGNGRRRSLIGMIIAVVGFAIFLLGTSPELFGLDRSPVIGFVQISVFLVGLAIICIGGYLSLIAMWGGRPRTIGADIGTQLVAK